MFIVESKEKPQNRDKSHSEHPDALSPTVKLLMSVIKSDNSEIRWPRFEFLFSDTY